MPRHWTGGSEAPGIPKMTRWVDEGHRIRPGRRIIGGASGTVAWLLAAVFLLGFGSPANALEERYEPEAAEAFRDALPERATVTEVAIHYDTGGIRGVQVHYQLENGLFNMLPMHGARAGMTRVLGLQPGERILGVRGTQDEQRRVRTLFLVTNQREYGTDDIEAARVPFEYRIPADREFGGFRGYLGPVLRALALVTRVSPAVVGTEGAISTPQPQPPVVPRSTTPPTLKGWHVRTRDFTCASNGDELDQNAEVYGDLTFVFDTGDGRRMAFLLARARDYALSLDCASHAPLQDEAFQHVDLVILAPPGALTTEGFWFLSGLKEADDGSRIDPDDDLASETVHYPLNVRGSAGSHLIEFVAGDPRGSPRFRLVVDVEPVFR